MRRRRAAYEGFVEHSEAQMAELEWLECASQMDMVSIHVRRAQQIVSSLHIFFVGSIARLHHIWGLSHSLTSF